MGKERSANGHKGIGMKEVVPQPRLSLPRYTLTGERRLDVRKWSVVRRR